MSSSKKPNQTGLKGLDLIKGCEGLRLKAYPDPGTGGNPWTIGYGHTKGVQQGQLITKEQALLFLKDDLHASETSVCGAVTVDLNQNQFDALVSFVFNVGASAFRGSTLLKLLNNGEYSLAADQFLRWDKAAGKMLPGLRDRRSRERELFLDKEV